MKKALLNIAITHPEKILYPEDKITKLELVEYYYNIRQWIMPYIKKRILTIVRCPDGYTKECFFQKHVNETTPKELRSIAVREKDETEQCIYIDDVAGLLALPQMGTLEIHTWGSAIKDFEKPDMIVFDLDPAPEVKWKRVVETAFEFRDNFKKLRLKSFVKTTGGKGLHVVIPIKPKYDWNEIKDFAHQFVDFMVAQNPEKFVSNMAKKDRNGKIFLDYLRNQRGATFIAPYSTRARKNAPIATPVAWDELTDDIRDTQYTMKTIFQRLNSLKKDPWKDFFKIQQTLKLDKLSHRR